MCLVSKTKQPYIAKNNITCYKVYKINYWSSALTNNNPFVELVSHFVYSSLRSFPYTLDESNITTEIFKLPTNNTYSIGRGVFHTNSSLDSIFMDIMCYFYDVVIVKCIIPKGTEYFSDSNTNELGSKKLILQKILSPGECYTILKENGMDSDKANYWYEKYEKRYRKDYVKFLLNHNKKCIQSSI